MSATQHQVQFGNTTIDYELSFDDRKTLAISVHPSLAVTVTAPYDTPLDKIQAKVHKRAPWILRQQREFELYLPPIPPRQYVSGETHRYLGRQYRLKVVKGEPEWVRMDRGFITVRLPSKDDRDRVQALLDAWYLRQARRVFHECLHKMLPRFGHLSLPDYELQIRKLEARWGSCSAAGVITLNLRLIQVPKTHIEYVIVHELCHLVEHNHSKRFYLLLDQVMPDWQQCRRELNMLHLG